MCSHLGRDWALDRPKHHTRTLSSLPKPVISLPPHPPPSVSPELWVVPGAELEALTESRLRPITCAAVAGGPRSEGPRDHTGGGQEVDAGPAPQPSLGCTHALESAQGPPPLVLQVEAATVPRHLSPSQVLCQPADSLLSVCSPELGCFIYCLNTLF